MSRRSGLHPADVEPLAAAIEQLARSRQYGRRRRARGGDHSPGGRGRRDRAGRGRRRRAGRVSRHAARDWSRPARAARAIGLPGGGGWAAASGGRPPTAGSSWSVRAGNNLQNVTVEFPLGVLCLVTGVSGAGKVTLVEKTLYPALAAQLAKKKDDDASVGKRAANTTTCSAPASWKTSCSSIRARSAARRVRIR